MNRITLTEIDGLWYAEHNAGAWAWGTDIDNVLDRLKTIK